MARVALDPNGKDKKWTKAEVKKEVSPRSYRVETDAGIYIAEIADTSESPEKENLHQNW